MEKVVTRLFHAPQQSFFLFGPRGTGKSTWLTLTYPEALVVDLLEPDVYRRLSARPELLRDMVLGTKQNIIIIDEVQKLPELLTIVHSLIEKEKSLQFILTGSSARKLKRTGVDLLAGRAIVEKLHPFMAVEIPEQFQLKSALSTGLVPLVVSSVDPFSTLKTYISLYIKEEVQEEALVRNVGHFSRFLEVMAFSHGSLLNLSNIARDCELSRSMVENYLSILEDLLIGVSLPVFTKRARRKTVSHPKFYYFDAGVYQSLRRQGPLDVQNEVDGCALEGLVLQHLRAWNDYRGGFNELYYWRTRAGVEVDFILYGNECFYAIEIKNSKQVFNKDLSGLKAFCEDYPEATSVLLYRGNEQLKINNILCLPVEAFLLNLHPNHDSLL